MINHMEQDIAEFVSGYINTAFWSSTDQTRADGGDPLENNYSALDLAPNAMDRIVKDCREFVADNADDVEAYCKAQSVVEIAEGSPLSSAGGDFWLTRNRHGVGYWDRGIGQLGERLTDAAHSFGEIDLYVGDDGRLYI